MHAVVKNLSKSGRYYWVITDFEVKYENKEIVNYYGRRRAVPQEVINSNIEPLYEKLLQIEQASGVDASEKYFYGFLEEQGKDYDDYIEEIITACAPKEEKKGFFARFFG